MLAALVMFLLRNLMTLLVLAIGLRTTTQALASTWDDRALVGKALAVLLLGVPVLAIITVTVLPLGDRATTFVALMAACPGAPMVLSKFRDRPVVVTILAIVSLLAPITVAAWVAILNRVLHIDLAVDHGTLAMITVKQILPLGVGILIASLWPELAKSLARVVWYAFMVAFAIAIVVVLVKGGPALLDLTGWHLLAVLVMAFGSAAMGDWAGRPDPDDRRVLASIAVLGNPALAIAVIAATIPGWTPGALVFAYLLLRALALVPYTLWAKHRSKRPPPPMKLEPPAAMPSGVVPGR